MDKREVVEYLDEKGNSPFGKWFSRINALAAARITTALYRLEQGNFSNTKSIGEGVFEFKLDFGPGYRIYFGQQGNRLVILLCGGTKKQQNTDIRQAKKLWAEYKRHMKSR